MKKLVLTIAIILTSFSFVNANNQINNSKMNEDDSYYCRKKAYDYANENNTTYGSTTWQQDYILTKRLCESGDL